MPPASPYRSPPFTTITVSATLRRQHHMATTQPTTDTTTPTPTTAAPLPPYDEADPVTLIESLHRLTGRALAGDLETEEMQGVFSAAYLFLYAMQERRETRAQATTNDTTATNTTPQEG